MNNITDVAKKPPINPALAQAIQIAANNDPTALAKEFDVEVKRAKAVWPTRE